MGILLYGVVCYVLFLLTFAYAFCFVEGFAIPTLVPKVIDSGPPGSVGQSALINVLVLAVLAVQHTVMARPAFKRWWTQIIPQAMERSTYVLMTVLAFGLIFWQWRPMTDVVWQVDHAIGRGILYGVSFGGFGLVLYSTFLIDHFDLFGLRQVVLHYRRQEAVESTFVTPWLYTVVRNPLMLGFIIGFWATPTMTYGHLLFAVVTTAYIFVGIQFEERDLANMLGDDYRQFRERTPMLIPWPRKRADS